MYYTWIYCIIFVEYKYFIKCGFAKDYLQFNSIPDFMFVIIIDPMGCFMVSNRTDSNVTNGFRERESDQRSIGQMFDMNSPGNE